MIKVENFYEIYGEMVRETFKEIDSKKILDVSIGTFRISKEYMKRMKNNRKNSLILNYPFQCQDGVYSYPLDENSKMLEYMKNLILEYVEESKIFI
jgi:spore photoproduct lyase